MNKILLGILGIILLTGCTIGGITTSPTKEVESVLSKYQTNDPTVLTQLDTAIANENMTDSQKAEYKTLMKKQYGDLIYDVKSETIDGNNAIVSTEIEVYDFAKTLKTVDAYVDAHPDEFKDENGNFSNKLYTDYKLAELTKVTDRIKYTIDFSLTKTNNVWTVDNLSEMNLQKIHGIYTI